MPSESRAGQSSLKPILALALLALTLLVLAGVSSGEGTVIVNLGDDIVTQEDTELSINSLVSYTGHQGLDYAWDFGDGTTSAAQRPSHAYTMAGTYTVSLTVSDSDGTQDSDSILVEVLNVRPIADAGGDSTVFEGTTVTFDGSDSWDTPSDLPLLTYEWDFGDGHQTSSSRENKIVTHTYADSGVYIVRLVVRDDDWTASNYAFMESQLIEVTGTSSGSGTLSFFFDLGNGSASSNSSGSSAPDWELYWDFGDGTYSTGNSASHTYEEDGLYIVTLILTDAFGAMSVHHILITVLNYPPTAEAGPDASVDEDETVTFQGTGSDPGGGPLDFDWSFGDGSSGTGATVDHAFTKAGEYTVTLTVTDLDGLTATDTCKVTVSNVNPVAGITTGQAGNEGDAIALYGVTSTDTTSDIPLLTYAWTFGDGSTGTGISTTHVYAEEGTYTVTLTVTDDDGAQDVASIGLSVSNAVPTATITSVTFASDPLLPNDNVTFVGSASDAGSQDTLTCAWDLGDGNTSTGTSVVHAYSTPGTYTVKFTVTDDDGASSTATTTVTVATLDSVTEVAQDLVDDAPSSAFSKSNDQSHISDLFDDLLDAISEGDSQKIDSRIHVLQVQIGNKVTDATLRQQLLDILANLDDSVG